MHSATALAILFALGSTAIPSNRHGHFHHKRDGVVVMTTEVVQETVTVGPGGNPLPTQDSSDHHEVDHHQEQPVHVKWVQNPPQQHDAPQPYQAPPPQAPPAPKPEPQQVAPPPPPAPKPEPEKPAPPPAPAAPAGYDKSGKEAPKFGDGEAASEEYKQATVLAHNCHRANHSAPALQWDDSLAAAAKAWGAGCVYAHSSTNPASNFPDGYGQNIAAGTNGSGDDDVAAVISGSFYNAEVGDFPFPIPPSGQVTQTSKDVGHFSQVVWKGTTHAGCWTGWCPSMMGMGAHYTVCNYGPPGNVYGQYGDNVFQSDHSQDYTNGT